MDNCICNHCKHREWCLFVDNALLGEVIEILLRDDITCEVIDCELFEKERKKS